MPSVNVVGGSGNDRIRVEGLADLQRELRKIDKELPKRLTAANKKAAELVATDATGKAEGEGGVAAKSAPSIKAKAEQRGASVTLGGAKFPFALGAEYGGRGRPTTQQFEPWRGSGGSSGYFLWPAVRSTKPASIALLEHELNDVIHSAFPN